MREIRSYAVATVDDCKRELHRLYEGWRAGAADDFGVLDGPELARTDLARDPVVLLGASNEFALRFIEHAVPHYRVVAICDNFKVGAVVAGRTVQTDAELASLARANPGLVAVNLTWGRSGTRYFEAAARRAGIPCLPMMLAFRRAGIASSYALIDGRTEKTLASFDELMASADLYVDELSRATVYRLLLSRLTHERRWLNRINVEYHTMYFSHGLFELDETERFADVGAYTGDSIDTFCWHVGNSFGRIDAFEPNPEVLAQLTATAAKRPNVFVHAVGAGAQRAETRLRSAGLSFGKEIASFVDATAETPIAIRRLDDELPEGATLIKMDIEGSEAAALAGAAETIRRDRPNLAICAYHVNNDIFELARQIRDLEPTYRLYLRHHSDFEWDTVIYATADHTR